MFIAIIQYMSLVLKSVFSLKIIVFSLKIGFSFSDKLFIGAKFHLREHSFEVWEEKISLADRSGF